MNQPFLIAIAGIALLAAGIAIGYVLGRSRGDKQSAQRANRVQEEYDAYRGRVTEHFRETAGQFQALGEQYRDLYRHLASGAESLCETGAGSGRLEFRPPPELVHDPGKGSGRGASQGDKPPGGQPLETGPAETGKDGPRVTAGGEVPAGESASPANDRPAPQPGSGAEPRPDGPRQTAAGELPPRETEEAGTGETPGNEAPGEDDEPKPAARAAVGRS